MASSYEDIPLTPTTDIGDLKKRIKYRLGWPQLKLEIQHDQIVEQIKYAIRWYYKFATGTSSYKQWLLFWLIPGQKWYTLPDEVITVTDYSLDTSLSGINTLFTLENYLWNYGFLNFFDIQRGQFSLLSYHLVLDYIETLKRYVTGKYHYQYVEWRKQLYVEPSPDSTQLSMIECVTKVPEDYMYSSLWIEDYAAARCKLIIGEIRSKFSGALLPGLGSPLNGPEMKSEARAEIEILEKRLRSEESEGFPIIIG